MKGPVLDLDRLRHDLLTRSFFASSKQEGSFFWQSRSLFKDSVAEFGDFIVFISCFEMRLAEFYDVDEVSVNE
jgi:hypothetical protein